MLLKLRERIREEYGSQAFFSKKMGVHPQQMSRYILCENKIPGERMLKFAAALKIPNDQLSEFFLENDDSGTKHE